ncbi:toll/interleukin-1 receptor domain-containing protein [Methyloceanibacter sp.]|uniref:toll/interleukin-1 receptor domain-containing protein n=1 Tax=Methyloceanibacter sp. TaxID=1965321 RepID=UPI002CC249B2|nr:toll/interleukin-1 receptor domain-containing protein [Methyloceanibacter sp.]HML93104.1 toll/interleukin-1 receptor domain-containing protein [Methyloceanibacter sp.]
MFGWSISAGLTPSHRPRTATYEGFITCSECDAPWAEQLARHLERYYAICPAVGKRHFFRAPAVENADYALPQTTINALEASRSLIVICSPAAARSHHVNEEIRAFKTHHPSRPVFPLIVDGKPGDEDGECFPPLLRFELDDDGRIAKGPIDVEATDARQGTREHERAAARIASDLLGLSSDRRARREPRRKTRASDHRLGFLMNLSIVVGFAIIVVWNGLTTNEAFLDRTLYLVSTSLGATARQAIAYGTPQTAVVNVLEYGESMLSDVMKRGPLTPQTEYRRATVLLQLAGVYRDLGDKEKALALADDAQHLLFSLRNVEAANAKFERRLEIAEEDLATIRAEQDLSVDRPEEGPPLSKLPR